MKRLLGLCLFIATTSIASNNVTTKNENPSPNNTALFIELKKKQIERHQTSISELERNQLWTVVGIAAGGYVTFGLSALAFLSTASQGYSHKFVKAAVPIISGLTVAAITGSPTAYLARKLYRITQRLKELRAQRDQAAMELESHLKECLHEPVL